MLTGTMASAGPKVVESGNKFSQNLSRMTSDLISSVITDGARTYGDQLGGPDGGPGGRRGGTRRCSAVAGGAAGPTCSRSHQELLQLHRQRRNQFHYCYGLVYLYRGGDCDFFPSYRYG